MIPTVTDHPLFQDPYNVKKFSQISTEIQFSFSEWQTESPECIIPLTVFPDACLFEASLSLSCLLSESMWPENTWHRCHTGAGPIFRTVL